METVFPTSTPAMLEELRAQNERLHAERSGFENEIEQLKQKNNDLSMNYNAATRLKNEMALKIDGVRGYILDVYSETGKIENELMEIAELLDINLTKRVTGTYTIEVEYDFEAPLYFDNDDLELSYTIECDSHDVTGFDYNEISADWSSEDME